jgi:hypothetical protein
MFSQAFIQSLVVLALIWTGLGALALAVLLVRDLLKGKLW